MRSRQENVDVITMRVPPSSLGEPTARMVVVGRSGSGARSSSAKPSVNSERARRVDGLDRHQPRMLVAVRPVMK